MYVVGNNIFTEPKIPNQICDRPFVSLSMMLFATLLAMVVALFCRLRTGSSCSNAGAAAMVSKM